MFDTLEDAIDAAKAQLPEDWCIEITVTENGVHVTLTDPDNQPVMFNRSGSLAEQVTNAYEKAVELGGLEID